MVGITLKLAYAELIGLRAFDQPWTNRWQFGRPWPTSFVNVGPTKLPTKCQRWPNEWLLSGYIAQDMLTDLLIICFINIKRKRSVKKTTHIFELFETGLPSIKVNDSLLKLRFTKYWFPISSFYNIIIKKRSSRFSKFSTLRY